MILEWLNSYAGMIILSLIVTGFIIIVRLSKKYLIKETPSVMILFNVLGLLSMISVTYYIVTNGKFIFGNEPKDLFIPLAVSIIFITINSIREIRNYIFENITKKENEFTGNG